MGVPVFFKWLSMRNPKIIKDAAQPEPEDYSSGNPAIDNFYIDMNGLIHPACNPREENIKKPTNFEQQCANIYDYIDKLMNIVRPSKTLYLAIDGVAPRAKMNQQRSRRFRAALESAAKADKKTEMLQKFKQIGAWNQQLQDYATKKQFDSNTITPGTEFLCNVSNKIRQYIKNRLETHRLWKNLVVVFSDANCPGEGEHKIMDYIRQERASESYARDQSHCIYGADADLIMLGLATHEPKFFIIREIVIAAKDKFCTSCQQRGHYFMDCIRDTARSIEDEGRVRQEQNAQSIDVQFQFIRIQMVREYIHFNYMRSIIPFGYDLERIIDDFIFLCFFVGNDFLPHVPCLSIREGGIDVLMRVYEYCLALMPDYITKAGSINMKSLKVFVDEMTHYQEPLVEEMIIREANTKQRQINNRAFEEREKNKKNNKILFEEKPKQLEDEDYIDLSKPLESFKAAMDRMNKDDPFNLDDYSVFNHNIYGYKQKYYKQKFKITPGEFLELKHNLSRSYMQALKWICEYYYKGVPSWSWFYPFHYSPFFTDLLVPEESLPDFESSTPFKPFEQLMAVFPARSCQALPKFLHFYMKDVKSPIIDYYPSDFHIDLVGKKFAWLGEVILPFIDDKRLLAAIGNYQSKLTPDQLQRNRFGVNNVYINKYGNLGRKINKQAKVGISLKLAWQDSHQIQGDFKVLAEEEDYLAFTFQQPMGRPHSTALLEGSYLNPLQQIDQTFMSKTDRNAFGGLRYIKVIEDVMYRRREKLRSARNASNRQQQPNQYEKEDHRGQRYRSKDDRERSRSRDKNRNHQNYNRNYGNQRGDRYGQNQGPNRHRHRDGAR